ncbi:NADP-dependent oxidoreductase [Nocardia sp. NEAU-351]|uniref:NADP-dependent oxidoreductase n=2 Tax=Nocardia bovistercoris TaxID=2785916 RepID=A0A931IDU3_9NOCA|nr:NADP-dependent oxidoreductase [Nocardia bovistercoris]
MKAVVVERFGGPEVLVEKQVPRPEPGPFDALVRVRAAGVNPLDLYRRAGYANIPEHMRPPLPDLPFIPGVDASGVVVAVGDRVTRLAPGDEVFGLIRFPALNDGGHAYAEYVTAPQDHLARKPARLDHLEAAAAPLVALTAQQFLFDHAGVRPGDAVLVNGAGGGVGHILVQLAAHAGAKVVAVASGRHRELLERLGVDTFVDYTVTPVEDWPHGVDFLFDSVGGPQAYRFTPVVRDGGTIMPIFHGDYRPDRAITVRHNQVHSDGDQLTALAELVDAGGLHVAVDSVYPLAEAAAAHRRAETGHIRGKIVLRVT